MPGDVITLLDLHVFGREVAANGRHPDLDFVAIALDALFAKLYRVFVNLTGVRIPADFGVNLPGSNLSALMICA